MASNALKSFTVDTFVFEGAGITVTTGDTSHREFQYTVITYTGGRGALVLQSGVEGGRFDIAANLAYGEIQAAVQRRIIH
ncbi:MAG: hypothetical protein H6907_20860 [Hyphomicrobiales bacterium]|nr:hypothetical protein [Hyphomicrobiales bacterium]MCP5374194.1 hypothetical protein [Hyphomicrobiales bacterium]